MKREPNIEYVLSLSYGKDSLACLGAIEELGWPLDRIIHAEVWATDDIPADLPPMISFKAKADEIIRERYGIEVEHQCAVRNGEKLTYEKLFYHIPVRKKKTLDRFGEGGVSPITGFPLRLAPWCNSRLKLRNLQRVPVHNQRMVQKAQTPGFLLAPLHKGQRQILCSTSGLLLTSLNALSGIRNLVSKCPWWKLGGMKPTAESGVKRGIYCPRFTQLQQGGGVGSATIKE